MSASPRQIRIEFGEVTRLVIVDDELRGVELADGRVVERSAALQLGRASGTAEG